MKEVCRQARAHGRKIGFVPTMGALHEGHLSLIRRIKELADIVVVSIFVNPTQFGPLEDFERYPRDLARDVDRCIAEGVDYVFAPSAEDMYGPESRTSVDVEELSSKLEGASRPGHFRGVATVVLKLFNIIRPTVAAFGQKDLQQAAVIRRMVADLMIDVEILVLPTVRGEDEVALSSRNRYLSADDRAAARAIPRALEIARRAVEDGSRDAAEITGAARAVLAAEPRLRVDYLELVDPARLDPVRRLDGEAALVVAVALGDVRLIDNTLLHG
jgi:pantoate--beta-alanine ligase